MVRRTVLVVDDSMSIRNLIYILLSAQKLEAGEGREESALASFAGGEVGSVLLDLRTPVNSDGGAPEAIVKMRHSLFGGVLYISGELSGPGILERIKHNCLTRARRVSILYEIWDKVLWLIRTAVPLSSWSSPR